MLSVGNMVTDIVPNVGNVGANAARQLINSVGILGQLLGSLTGGLVTNGGKIVEQLTSGLGGGFNESSKTFGNSFKEFGSMFGKLGSQTPSVKAAGHLSTRDYSWQG